MTVPTSLVFCNPEVDPDVVTRILGVEPTFAGREPHLGTWKLAFPGDVEAVSLEEQLQHWLVVLAPKAAELRQLRGLGYAPYLDCPGLRADLALWIEPAMLHHLGDLQLALSIWLYEHPALR
jgi:hypothetical protein